MKTSEMFKISFTIKTLTLVVLHSVSWYQVIIGPLNAYFENRTITRENHINLDEGRAGKLDVLYLQTYIFKKNNFILAIFNF